MAGLQPPQQPGPSPAPRRTRTPSPRPLKGQLPLQRPLSPRPLQRVQRGPRLAVGAAPSARCGTAGCCPGAPLTYWVRGFSADDVSAVFAARGWREERSGAPPIFARFGRMTPRPRTADPRRAAVRPFPYERCLKLVSDKVLCSRALQKAGFSGCFPETYTSVQAFLRRPQGAAPTSQPPLWFVKPANGRRGRGVEVCASEDVPGAVRAAQCPCVIQRGVAQPMCVDGRKVVFRHHMLVTPDLGVWVHRDGLAVFGARSYDPSSTDREVQVLGALRGAEAGERPPRALLSAPALFRYGELQAGVRAIAQRLAAVLAPSLRASVAESPGVHFYALLGLDTIWDEGAGAAALLEANEFPALTRQGQGADARAVCSATVRDFAACCVFPAAEGLPRREGGWQLVGTAASAALADVLPADGPPGVSAIVTAPSPTAPMSVKTQVRPGVPQCHTDPAASHLCAAEGSDCAAAEPSCGPAPQPHLGERRPPPEAPAPEPPTPPPAASPPALEVLSPLPGAGLYLPIPRSGGGGGHPSWRGPGGWLLHTDPELRWSLSPPERRSARTARLATTKARHGGRPPQELRNWLYWTGTEWAEQTGAVRVCADAATIAAAAERSVERPEGPSSACIAPRTRLSATARFDPGGRSRGGGLRHSRNSLPGHSRTA